MVGSLGTMTGVNYLRGASSEEIGVNFPRITHAQGVGEHEPAQGHHGEKR